MNEGPSLVSPRTKRFRVSKRVLQIDRWMSFIIAIGGIGVIAAVLGIFFFILKEVLPLLKSTHVKEISVVETGIHEILFMGVDEWGSLPVFVTKDGVFHFIDLEGERGIFKKAIHLPEGVHITTGTWSGELENVIFGTNTGQYIIVDVDYEADTDADGNRVVDATLHQDLITSLSDYAIESTDYYEINGNWIVAVIDVEKNVWVQWFFYKECWNREESELCYIGSKNVSDLIPGKPIKVRTTGNANGLLVATEEGDVFYLSREKDNFQVIQRFKPFGDLEDRRIASMNSLLGRSSYVFTSVTGENRIFSVYVDPNTGHAHYEHTKSFPSLLGGSDFYSLCTRNKSFLVGNGAEVSLRYATTQSVRWQEDLPYTPIKGLISTRYDRIFLVEGDGTLHIYSLDDPFPESGWKAYFEPLVYEGHSQEKYMWQSTGASDTFEPKLSMVPLILGSIKGTLYAMLFAIPIALLAAIYTSQFLKPNFKEVIKPVMEIMASLPSVVLGFLGALWLAPVIETKVPSIMLILLGLPLSALLAGSIWGKLPRSFRVRLPRGCEFIAFLPILIAVAWGGWGLGPFVERVLFIAQNPATGAKVADFTLWWQQVTGLPFEQRNSLIVGFMMGFAVIPLIFTIAEDSMANVPKFLMSASLALGASRWQTTCRVIIPTASPGIFSALMIGLGRSVGETMIVVMATGNTPIMDFNIFSGMRTLSANIAVELPEAPQGGTLYQTLFLGAFLLFLLTFIINTLAEFTRKRLREKYKTVS